MDWNKYGSNQIKFKNTTIRPNTCSYSDAYIHIKGIITGLNTSAQGEAQNNRNKKTIFKNCA